MAERKKIESVCFVCELNQGRSVHLELSTRRMLREKGSRIRVISAGLRRGRVMKSLRRAFLMRAGVPAEEIDAHRPKVFAAEHAQADLILVVELPMKARLAAAWPGLEGKIMTVRGFVQGATPESDRLSRAEAHIEDTGGHTDKEKLELYAELEEIAEQVVQRLLDLERGA